MRRLSVVGGPRRLVTLCKIGKDKKAVRPKSAKRGKGMRVRAALSNIEWISLIIGMLYQL